VVGLTVWVVGVVFLVLAVTPHMDEVLGMLEGACCLVPGMEWLLIQLGTLAIISVGGAAALKALIPRHK
jgi:hypothetical protein